MILFIENSKDTTRKLLELINEFSEVAGYKINAQKSVAFLYTNNKGTYIYKTEIDPQTQKTNLWLPKGKGGGEKDKLGVWDEQIFTTIYKIDNQQGPTILNIL